MSSFVGKAFNMLKNLVGATAGGKQQVEVPPDEGLLLTLNHQMRSFPANEVSFKRADLLGVVASDQFINSSMKRKWQ